MGPRERGQKVGEKRIREIGMFIAHYTDCPPPRERGDGDTSWE